MVLDYNDYFEIEFAALMSFKRFHIIQTLEVKHNLVIAWCVKDLAYCPEHMQVGNLLPSVWTLTYISLKVYAKPNKIKQCYINSDNLIFIIKVFYHLELQNRTKLV